MVARAFFIEKIWWSRRESNPYLEFRKRLFYPLNYGTVAVEIAAKLPHFFQNTANLPNFPFRNIQMRHETHRLWAKCGCGNTFCF